MKINRIIRFIRETSGFSQEEFAARIGVSRLAVTRWENDKATPSRIAQGRIYDIAKEKGVLVYDFMISDLPVHNAGLSVHNADLPVHNFGGIGNGVVTLFHGSKEGIKGDIRPISRKRCDFGSGFYLGTEVQQPLTLICTYSESVLYVVEFDLNGLKIENVPTGIEWAMLVAYSRGRLEQCKGTGLYEKCKNRLENCDVVVGAIANDRMFFVLDRFFEGVITDKGLVESLSALQLGVQYVALTEKACSQIKIVSSQKLSELERLCLGDISERGRKYGIETANDICKSHRREGRFFDEIIREGN